jgi:hypothetical protein
MASPGRPKEEGEEMKLGAMLLVVLMVALTAVTAVLGADMTNAARKELTTAITETELAAGFSTTAQIELTLHHVVNCLEGKLGKNFHKESGDVCEGQGTGIFADLKDSGMAGAHALPYAEIANQVALWGLGQAMAKDVGKAKTAAAVTKLILEQAVQNFK